MPIYIDAEELAMALDDHGAVDWFLDIKNGELLPVTVDSEELEGLRTRVEDDHERYMYISPIMPGESMRIIRDFIETVEDESVATRLFSVTEKSKPFRRFREALLSVPETREKWFEFHRQAMNELASEWLIESGVKAVLQIRSPVKSN